MKGSKATLLQDGCWAHRLALLNLRGLLRILRHRITPDSNPLEITNPTRLSPVGGVMDVAHKLVKSFVTCYVPPGDFSCEHVYCVETVYSIHPCQIQCFEHYSRANGCKHTFVVMITI